MDNDVKRLFVLLARAQEEQKLSDRLSSYRAIITRLQKIVYTDVYDNSDDGLDASFVDIAFNNCSSVLNELCAKQIRKERNAQEKP